LRSGRARRRSGSASPRARFGALAFLTRFCLRRALVGPVAERASARGVWALALAVALIGTQAAVAAGWIGFDAHRFHAEAIPFC
jgi:hypothetical protein